MNSFLALFFNLISLILMTVCTATLIKHSLRSKMTTCFSVCQILIINWIVCHLLDIFTPNLIMKIIFSDIGYISVCTIGTMFLMFSLYYIEANVVQNLVFKIIMFIPSGILFFIKVTDPILHLFFKSFLLEETRNGIGLYINAGYNYILLIISVCLILIKNIKTYKEKLPQIILISLAATIPLIINLLSITNFFKFKYDFTSISFSVSSILVFLAVYKYEFISVSPFTINHLMSSIEEAVLIVDKRKKVISINDSMKKAFSMDDDYLYKNYMFAMTHISKNLIDRSGFDEFYRKNNRSETMIQLNDDRFFRVNKIPIFNRDKIISNVFMFSDMTLYYKFTNELSIKNNELIQANEKLAEMSKVEKNLAVEKERNRIAQELHDSMGHGLVSLMTLLKLSQINQVEIKDNVKKAFDISDKLLGEVRECVSGIRKSSEISIIQRIKYLIEEMNLSNDYIEVSVLGDEKPFHMFASNTIFSICREAITNSIRHGNANKIDVIIKFYKDSIRLYIIDNGVGCDKVIESFGLKGMREKVMAIGGKIEFASLQYSGFSVKVSIPVEVVLV